MKLLAFTRTTLFALALCVSAMSWTQAQTASMTPTELQQRANELVEGGQYVAARPYLLEMVGRWQNEGEEYKQRLEAVYFFLGVGYMVEYGSAPSNALLEDAIRWFQRLEKDFPQGQFSIVAGLAMADAYRAMQQWKKAAEVYTKLLRPPLEGRMNSRQMTEALKKISQAYYILRDWKAGEPWFKQLLVESLDPEDQAMAAGALMEAYVSQQKFDEALTLFPYLVGETAARYQLQLNVALIDAGDRLVKSERYGEAMLMYRMVLTTEEIIDWQSKRLANLESQLSLLRMTTTGDNERSMELDAEIFNTKAQLDALRKMKSYTPELRIRIARNYPLTGRDWESFWAYKELIRDYPNHEFVQDFYYYAFTGAVNIGLADEVIALGEAYLKNPSWNAYRNDVILGLAQFYLERHRYDDFFTIAKRFIQQNPSDRYCSQIVFLMGQTFVKLDNLEEMIDLFKGYIKSYPDTHMQDGLHYWVGMAYLFNQEYAEALPYFEHVLKKYPDDAYAEDSLYRSGICLFGTERIDEARKAFQQFVRKYPDSKLRGEVEYFLADIEAAVPNVKEALVHYENVEKFSDNHAFIEMAYFRAGELLEVNKRYDEMVVLFERYISKFEGKGDMTAAIYQLGRAKELQERPGDMLRVYWGAVRRYGDNPDTYGLDAIIEEYPGHYETYSNRIAANLAFLEKVATDSAFRRQISDDRTTLFTYFSENPGVTEDVRRPFYDRGFRVALVKEPERLTPLLEKYRKMRDEMPKESPVEQFRIAFEEARAAGQPTLAFRLQQALWTQGVDVIPGQVFTEGDFQKASPSTLLWMSERNRDFDKNLSRNALLTIVENHERSELLLQAYLRLGDIEMEDGNYDVAMEYYRLAKNKFPSRPEIVHAILKLGDAYLATNLPVEAREQYQMVLNNRSWRGAPHAEAMYKIGQTYEMTEDNEMANTYYQRALIGYPAFPEWSGAASLASGNILQKMGLREEAISAYDEFLKNPVNEGTQYYKAIQNARSSL